MALVHFLAGAVLVANYIYHRWIKDTQKPKPAQEISIPRVDPGAVVPLIYGRCRVRSPWLAWTGTPTATAKENLADPSIAGGASFLYSLNMYYVLGIPFKDGLNRVHQIYVDDRKLAAPLGGLTGNGGFETGAADSSGALTGDAGYIGTQVEYLNGNSSQTLRSATSPFAATTHAGTKMVTEGGQLAHRVPGFRGYMSILLFNASGPGWYIGNSPRPGAYSFEASSYPAAPLSAQKIGEDANPIDVIKDVLVGALKLAEPASRVDASSFTFAAQTCNTEGLGYSRSFEDGTTAGEIIQEILEYVDAVLWEEPFVEDIGGAGVWRIKLIRNEGGSVLEYPAINPSNCDAITNVAFGGWTNLANKVRVVFSNRLKDYQEDSVTAQSMAVVAGQDGVVREIVLRYPGCCTEGAARVIAARELAARSRPLWRCRARVDRTLVSVTLGDVVEVTWPKAGISQMMFRVAQVTPGPIDSNYHELDLLQDATYVWRGSVLSGSLTSFPTS